MRPQAYHDMIEDFVRGRISANEFQSRYFAAFKAEPRGMDPELYRILDTLFAALDSYWEGWTTQNEAPPLRISERTLHNEAAGLLERLRVFLSGSSNAAGPAAGANEQDYPPSQ